MFVSTAGSEYVSLGGRDAEMTFGIGTIAYTELFGSARTISGGPNGGDSFKLTHLPSDAVATKAYGTTADGFSAGGTYKVIDLGTAGTNYTANAGDATVADATNDADTALLITHTDHTGNLAEGDTFTVPSGITTANLALLNVFTAGKTFQRVGGTNALTEDIEAVQAKVNTARVQAGSQYAAIESAVSYTTDLTAQYELGYNTVHDVNFSMETAHLAKNQILQQAATAMLSQANQGQQGLLQLIQG